jgi:ABC-type nitrate/sulfonate/bicarbonate transport system permease component
MAELTQRDASTLAPAGAAASLNVGRWLPLALAAALLALALVLAWAFVSAPLDHTGVVESTPGQLFLWRAGRAGEAPEAYLAQARGWLAAMGLAAAALAAAGLLVTALRPAVSRGWLFWGLVGFVILLLNVPLIAGAWYWLVLAGVGLALAAMFVARGSVSSVMGTVVVISALLLFWEVYIALGRASGGALPLTDFPWKLPHWQAIVEQLLQPARRNGPVLLVGILGDAALVTWREAFTGFIAGSLLGFALGTIFAHSRLLERALLPYAVASQTVPILALAPMIVTALGAGWVPVAVISAYLTFFPVTINTLRGLLSPQPTAVELMRSYAASRWSANCPPAARMGWRPPSCAPAAIMPPSRRSSGRPS